MVFLEALRLSNSKLGSDNNAMVSSVSEKDKLFMTSCEFASSKPLVMAALRVRPGKLSGSNFCTGTAKDSSVKTTCVLFSGIGMLSVTSIDCQRLNCVNNKIFI